MRYCLIVIFSFLAVALQAQEIFPAQEPPPRYLAEIKVNTVAELAKLLERAEVMLEQGNFKSGQDTSVAFILHGEEAKALFSPHYRENKDLVDLAARLSAFKVVDIKVCKRWMRKEGLTADQLPPFVSSVNLGPQEKRRLIQDQGYVYF